MGSIFRSRDMAFCEVFFQSEMAFNCVAALGELGVVQFNDMNAVATVQKPKFLTEIRRIDEMERKLHFVEKEIERAKIYMPDHIDNPPVLQPRDITKLETKLDELEGKLLEMDTDISSMNACQLELTERLLALEMTAPYLTDINLAHFHGHNETTTTPSSYHPVGRAASPTQSEHNAIAHMNFLVGVINRAKVSGFERMIWRLGGNNVYVRTIAVTNDLKDPKTGMKLLLNVFIAIFEGDMLREKIEAVAQAFHATIHQCPDRPEDRRQICEDIRPRIGEFSTVLKQAAEIRYQLLTTAARDIRAWKVQLRKVKSVYFTMNMLNLDVTKRYFIGHCWVPVEELRNVENALRDATKTSDGELLVPFIINQILPASTNEVPTYFPENKFTAGFQSIVNAFSVARYHEVNPALFTVITFPFLFSVMFSDAGHGIAILLFGLWLIWKEKSYREEAQRNETVSMILAGRYIILLMGIFSIYSGFMFNEFFGRSIKLFPSRWHSNFSDEYLLNHHDDHIALHPEGRKHLHDLPYPVGVDPVWYMASNRIVFTNSLKMKISVIFGVAHMFFGVVLSLGNHLYFRHYASIICEFVPQILLISCMFVYMDALIVYKWIVFDADSSGRAPSILLGMINMFMLQYPNETEADAFVNQNLKELQMIFVLISATCVPWLLLAKPLYLLRKSKRPISCTDSGQGRLDSSHISTPIPVLPRSGTGAGLMSPSARPFIQVPLNAEVIELAEVEPHPHLFTISPRPGDDPSTSAKSPPAKFSTLFSGDNLEDKISIKSNSNKEKLLLNVISGDQPVRNASNDTIMPTSPQTASQAAKLGDLAKGPATPFVREPSITYSPFPPAAGYREKLDESMSKKDESDGAFDFGEIFMLQVIHTIEYVLGLVSHTASYLRLWALSLAHAELSETLWMMILRMGFAFAATDATYGFIYIAVALLAWTVLTFAVLIFMESMSAFLHALRLHWVEFQSKFYIGSGRAFEPFTFKEFRLHLSAASSTAALT